MIFVFQVLLLFFLGCDGATDSGDDETTGGTTSETPSDTGDETDSDEDQDTGTNSGDESTDEDDDDDPTMTDGGEGTDENILPTLSITDLASTSHTPGSSLTISYTAADEDEDTLSFTIDFSSDNGNEWTAITTTASTSHEWTVPADESTTYLIRVTANDGTDDVVVTTGPFGVTSTAYTYNSGPNDIRSVLQANCSCHDAGSPSGGWTWESYADVGGTLGAQSKAERITVRTGGNTMPPSSPLSQANKDILLQWFWQGALE